MKMAIIVQVGIGIEDQDLEVTREEASIIKNIDQIRRSIAVDIREVGVIRGQDHLAKVSKDLIMGTKMTMALILSKNKKNNF